MTYPSREELEAQGKVSSEQPGARAEFDRYFPGLENKE